VKLLGLLEIQLFEPVAQGAETYSEKFGSPVLVAAAAF
jgi:hypothetical protein